MKQCLHALLILSLSLGFSGCQTIEDSKSDSTTPSPTGNPTPQAFAWPFLEPEAMVAQGGMTRGSEVTLVEQSSPAWLALQESNLNSFEKDRRAILAMVGDYRTGFQFIETGGFVANYTPPRPYFSWGTERVALLEDSGDFISLQHTLVMYIVDEAGNTSDPFVMKHWRQDWTYEKPEIHTYQGNRIWERQKLGPNRISGKWVQSVFQVDDSPRYEVLGKWTHKDQYSSWLSEASHRPLPRREFSVRDDYNILEGEHRITIAPTGWIHEQSNRKVKRQGNQDTYLAQETGFTRYELITSPDLSPALDSWELVGDYWASVRDTWKNIFENYDRFQLKGKVEGQSLWQYHFAHASEIEKSGPNSNIDWEKAAKDTISNFLNTGENITFEVSY